MKRRAGVPGYELLERLSTGSTAEVFLARRDSGGVPHACVVKCVPMYRETERAFVKLFLAEARLAARLHHPNVAKVYEIGAVGASHFVSMEYVHGATLASVVARARQAGLALPVRFVLAVVARIAAALHHAHAQLGSDGLPLGIVHRDLSPHNVMIGYDGAVKVLDFSVAEPVASEDTEAGTIKREVGYYAPERVHGRRLDRRSDLFSLGIMMWEMLTGARLFGASSDFANLHAIVTQRSEPPCIRRPELSPEVDAIVTTLLAKDPARRFQGADQLVAAIEDAAATHGMLLSASSVARFMATLFGPVAEPPIVRARPALPLPPPPEPEPEAKCSAPEPAYQSIVVEVEPAPAVRRLQLGTLLVVFGLLSLVVAALLIAPTSG